MARLLALVGLVLLITPNTHQQDCLCFNQNVNATYCSDSPPSSKFTLQAGCYYSPYVSSDNNKITIGLLRPLCESVDRIVYADTNYTQITRQACPRGTPTCCQFDYSQNQYLYLNCHQDPYTAVCCPNFGTPDSSNVGSCLSSVTQPPVTQQPRQNPQCMCFPRGQTSTYTRDPCDMDRGYTIYDLTHKNNPKDRCLEINEHTPSYVEGGGTYKLYCFDSIGYQYGLYDTNYVTDCPQELINSPRYCNADCSHITTPTPPSTTNTTVRPTTTSTTTVRPITSNNPTSDSCNTASQPMVGLALSLLFFLIIINRNW